MSRLADAHPATNKERRIALMATNDIHFHPAADSTVLPSFVSDEDEADPTVLNDAARAMNDEAATMVRAATLSAGGMGPTPDEQITSLDVRLELDPAVQIPTLSPPDFLGRTTHGPPPSAVPYAAIAAAIVVALIVLWWLVSLIG